MLQYDMELTGRKCRDRLVIHEPYGSRSLFSYERYLSRYGYYDYFDNILLDIIDSSLNGKQLVYTTNHPKLHIWFYTCMRKDRLLKQGGGFRAVVRKPGNNYTA